MARIPTPLAKLPPPKEGPSLITIILAGLLCIGAVMAIAVFLYPEDSKAPAAQSPDAQATKDEPHNHFAQDDRYITAGILEDRETGCQYITLRGIYDAGAAPSLSPRLMKDGTQFCGYGPIQNGEVK